MKKILVIGSNGRVGRKIVKEALAKGFDVTGLGRGDNLTELSKYIKMSVFELKTEDVLNYDVIVDAFGAWTADTIPGISEAMIHLAKLLDGSTKRLIVVGGAGSLYVDKDKKITVDMEEDFPDDWKPLAHFHALGLKYLQNTSNLNWTYISPACNFVPDGICTGEYQLGKDNLILNSNGESMISYADYAIALVDEIVNEAHLKERISVVGK